MSYISWAEEMLFENTFDIVQDRKLFLLQRNENKYFMVL